MRLGWLWLCLLALPFAGVSSCRRGGGNSGAPKAVAVREDGVIDLNLISFNLRYQNPGDAGERAWRQRVLGVVRMVYRETPDILGVQEALHGQVADLWASLPDYRFHGVGRDDGKKTGEYAGIFYRADRFQADPVDQGTFWLSDHPEKPGSMDWGNQFPRITGWLRLKDLATGRWFYVFNTHWDHRNQPSREKAALLLAARIDGRKHPSEPVVLIGDFNSLESNPGLLYLTGKRVEIAGGAKSWPNGLVDTFNTLHSGEKNRRTLHLWRNTREGSLKVDHILASKGAKVARAEILTGDKPMISDHFPVESRVMFPPD